MSILPFSEILQSVMEYAKESFKCKLEDVSAEQFFIATIDAISVAKNDFAEIKQADELLQLNDIDKNKARELLSGYLKEGTLLLDNSYMLGMYKDVSAMALKQGDKKIRVAMLLHGILINPSTNIKKIVEASTVKSTKLIIEEDILQDKKPDSSGDNNEQVGNVPLVPRDISTSQTEQTNSESNPQTDKNFIGNLVKKTDRIRKQLKDAVFGQDNAINVFASGYFQACMLSAIDKSRKRPKATFLFAGPPGVGKTFLAENIAKSLDIPFMRFDMSEYADKEANIEFCGSDKVYKNGKEGNVTAFVAKNPKCVLLFDEIEKAHLCVIHLFLQMLDAGRLRDNFTDEEVSFKDAIIILTTNAGRQLYEEFEGGDLSTVSRKVVIKALQKDINPETGAAYFPGAMCSRFASGNVVMFNHIGAHNLREIAKKEIERQAKNLENETNVKTIIDDKVYTALLFSEGSNADARTIRGRAETFFNDELYELLRLVASKKVNTEISQLEEIHIGVDLETANGNIRSLFEPKRKPKVLVYAHEQVVLSCRDMVDDIDFVGSESYNESVNLLKDSEFDFVMIDFLTASQEEMDKSINIEDACSGARDLFRYMCEQKKELPIYLIEHNEAGLTEEEKTSFMRKGVRGTISLDQTKDSFVDTVKTIAQALYQQEGLIRLARENKLVSYESLQNVYDDGKKAQIVLFDFEMVTAVDSEDSRNVLSALSKPNVRFDDVIGAKDAKEELKYFVEYLKNPKKYMGTGVKAPRGVLLYGPPGTGKTMLAKAMACEADVTFLAAEGNQFLKQYVGQGSQEVHNLFRTARKYAPAILFIDEIDAIAKERKGTDGGSAGVEETLTAFLTEMDGFSSDPSKPVFVLAATNFDIEPGRAKSLDPALMRRFDRRVFIDLPNKEDRIRFLTQKRDNHIALDISQGKIENISTRAVGMSLADMDSVVELALRSAIRAGSTKVDDNIFEEAFETFSYGEEKKWDIAQLERVARHEAGHAFLCFNSGEIPSYLTIVARGNHGGYMMHADQEGKAIYTKEELFDRIRTSLGGRAAEIVYYGEKDGISTGASGDLESATALAQRMICTYGMDEDFGLMVVNDICSTSSGIATLIKDAVNAILKEQMQIAIKLIYENKDRIDALVKELMVKNHLSADEIKNILS